MPFDDLGDAGEYESLDVKLAAAVNAVAKGRIATILTTMTETAANKGDFIPGRHRLIPEEGKIENNYIESNIDKIGKRDPRGDPSDSL